MIKSLSQLQVEIEKGQQFERKHSTDDRWEFVQAGYLSRHHLGMLVLQKRLRVKQIKG